MRTPFPESTFSHAFGVRRGPRDDWFDPKLHTDTDLFVDPFLMFEEKTPPWNTVQDRLIDFFNTAMEHVAAAGGNRGSIEWARAAAMFSFPEPPEFCLGYGRQTIFGAGSARKLGYDMLAAAQRAIEAGLQNINEFGELLLFGDGFGSDRISDMVCNIVKDDFVRYTQDVVARHGVQPEPFRLRHYGFDYHHDRWATATVDLPRNPCWRRRTSVLLVPQRFLDELPKMDDGEFWDWVYANQNEQLRKDLGYSVTQGLDRKKIIELARRRATLRRKYGVMYADRYRQDPPSPYDFETDPRFKVTAFEAGQRFSTEARLAPPADAAQFCRFVRHLVEEFRWVVEERGISRSFWSGTTPHYESRAQDLFHTAVLLACKERDIDLTPEADAGQGPVDFKFSAGWTRRAVVELKFAKSSTFWDNVEEQPPAYLRAEGISCGYIVVIQHTDQDCEPTFIDHVNRTVKRISRDAGWTYEAIFVDVRPKPSASKRKRRR